MPKSNYPRVFALYCISTGTVEYTSTQYTAVHKFLDSIPEILRPNFELVRYDACPFYENTPKQPKKGNYIV